jgi:hypothetical protein
MVKAAVQLLPSVTPVPDPATNYRHFRAFSAFKPPDHWSLDEQTREALLPDAEPV